MKTIELKPIKESTEDFEAIEKKIKEVFRREVYLPAIRELNGPSKTLTNAREDLLEAIRTGRITFYRGTFSGRFNASISKELKSLGARWDRKTGTFKISQSLLPYEVRGNISASESRFQEKISKIDKQLAKILPEEIADKVKVEHMFDRTLWKTNKSLQESVKGITVAPDLTPEMRKRIAAEWQDNMKIWIKDFTQEEISKLRKDLQKSVFTGNRYETAAQSIKKSYGVTENKAKFLARQETALLMAKFKETRYQAAGIDQYKWQTVAGTKNHPVRPSHKILEGKIFRWDDPPITTPPGEAQRRNNPGQDYNCRCFAKPIVTFK